MLKREVVGFMARVLRDTAARDDAADGSRHETTPAPEQGREVKRREGERGEGETESRRLPIR